MNWGELPGTLTILLVIWGGWIVRAWLDGSLRVSLPASIRPAAELAAHIIAGSILFSMLFSAAAGLNFLVDFFIRKDLAPKWLVMPSHLLEAVVWGVDAFGFVVFTFVELARFCREMVFGAGHHSSALVNSSARRSLWRIKRKTSPVAVEDAQRVNVPAIDAAQIGQEIDG